MVGRRLILVKSALGVYRILDPDMHHIENKVPEGATKDEMQDAVPLKHTRAWFTRNAQKATLPLVQRWIEYRMAPLIVL